MLFKKFVFWIKSSIGSDNGLTPNRQQTIVWTNYSIVYWHIYASLNIDELTYICDMIIHNLQGYCHWANHRLAPVPAKLSWRIWQNGSVNNPLQSCHNGHDGVSTHQPHDCLLNRLFGCRSKKTSKPRVTGHLWGEFTGDQWIPRTNGQ